MSLLRNMVGHWANRAADIRPPSPPPEQPAAQPQSTIVAPPAPATAQAHSSIRNPSDTPPVVPQDFVLGMIGQWDKRPERSRDGGTNGFMHVSSLVDLACQRKSALMAQHNVTHMETVSGGHRIMWAQGRATEKHIRDAVIGNTDGKIVYGAWECRCGYAKHTGFKPADTYLCAKCEHKIDVYREPKLEDTTAMITGSPDMTLVLGGFFLVNEIKSMTPDQFDALSSPLADHVTQGLMYREMYRRLGKRVHDKVVILYGRKQFIWGNAFGKKRVYKEFHVDALSRTSQSMVETCYTIAENLARHNAAKTLPTRTVCSSADSKLAKSCPVAHLCFGMR